MSYSPETAGAKYEFNVGPELLCLGLYRSPIVNVHFALIHWDGTKWVVLRKSSEITQSQIDFVGGPANYMAQEFLEGLNKKIDMIEAMQDIQDDETGVEVVTTWIDELKKLFNEGFIYSDSTLKIK